MNDDLEVPDLQQLKQEHRALDGEIRAMIESGVANQMELARLKKRKLRLKDEIQQMMDLMVPDIIA